MRMSNRNNKIILRFGTVFFTLILLVNYTNIFAQDTVKLRDPRFLFPNITDSTYFYKHYQTLFPGAILQTIPSRPAMYAKECKTQKSGQTIYGISFLIQYPHGYRFDSNACLTDWNYETDTIWLKLRQHLTLGDSIVGPAIDSVRINLQSERKVFLFEAYWSGYVDGIWSIWFDSIVREPVNYLFCEYFDTPVQIMDTSFFVTIELIAPRDTIISSYPGIYSASGCSNTTIETLCSNNNSLDSNTWIHLTNEYWFPLLPIIAPQGTPPPGWTPDPNPDPDPTEGIDKADNFDLKIYPNPARRQFSVQSGVQVLRVEMYDVMGRKVREWGSSSQSYDLDGIPSGLYTVKVMNAKGSTTKKMTIR